MTTETHWYYEERHRSFGWVSAYYGYKLTREQALAKMEQRKSEYPRARLRLCCQTTVTRSYRERHKA